MSADDQNLQLQELIGKTIRITKLDDTHEGILRGQGEIVSIDKSLKADSLWVLQYTIADIETREMHFGANDGWKITAV